MKNIVGLIPAGGLGTRMYPYKTWKELIAIGYRKECIEEKTCKVPNVIGEYVINNMQKAGIDQIYMIINNRKQELFRFFGDGSQYNTNIAYLSQELEDKWYGMPIGFDVAYPFLKNKTVLMGMPDTIIYPETAFKELLEFHQSEKADLTIGVFPTENPTKLAPVEINQQNDVLNIYDKPKKTSLYNTWNIAIWQDTFTELLHDEVKKYKSTWEENVEEILLSDIFMKAVTMGMKVKGKYFKKGKCYDIGSIQNLYEIKKNIDDIRRD